MEFELQAENGNGPDLEKWRDIRKKWLDKERTKSDMLKQKASYRWIIEGDENTRFFHSVIKRNYNKNNIRGLTINGVWNDSPNEIKAEAFRHFSSIFKEPNVDRPSLEDLSYPTLSLKKQMHSKLDLMKKKPLMQFLIVEAIKPRAPMSSKQKSVLFKVDFEKAFDCLNWEFLMEVMKSMGFGDKWRKWIHACLSSASISVLINGSPTNEFKVSRGVRQGDPLSPFLFILAAEGLNILSKAITDSGVFKGVEIGRDKILLSHLQYADDTVFLGKWSRENIYSIRNLLKCFELASGLKVNFQKSCIYGIGVDFAEVTHVANRIGCQVGKFPFTYLGLTIGSKMNKLSDWNPVVEKIKKRLSSWRMRSMSFGGRMVLIKSVLFSLPLYYFSLFRAPHCVLKSLERLCRSFFWGGSDLGSKMSWVLLSRKLVMEALTLFWDDVWIGDTKLSSRFPRLYHLENCKTAIVRDRVSFGPTCPIFEGNWTRQPSHRSADDLVTLSTLVLGYGPCTGGHDCWRWCLSSSGIFTVNKLTKLIEERTQSAPVGSIETLRNNLIPKKLEIFVWRALKRRLPC
ncbi:uncharacterized protein [Rutidosis leptorrhynchoides]|uniref:uncharacterized protein n=1 Tax=Rutidosis leptorrhynchoides TaxID=125765 RepID=UPI003A9A0747